MTKKLLGILGSIALIIGAIAIYVIIKPLSPPSGREVAPTAKTKVQFGVLPYLDHTYAIVGKEQGWFDEVGIDLEIKEVRVEQIIPWLLNGTVDVCSTPPGILMAAWDNAPTLRHFVFGNLFTGYAIMAQPSDRPKTYRQYRLEGRSPSEAARLSVAVMKGKKFAFPPEDAIRPFIDLALQKAGLSLDDVQSLVVDDPLTVNAMRRRTADFQVGGAPSRIALEGEGYVPIFTSADMLDFAQPTSSSKELAGVLQSGWATNQGFYEKSFDTILKLATVNYRIMAALKRPEFRKVHIAYLEKLTQTQFTPTQVESLYRINDFKTFEEQADWFLNPSSTTYYKHVNEAILQSWLSRPGYFKHPPKLEDIVFADRVYNELKKRKELSETVVRDVEARIAAGTSTITPQDRDAVAAIKKLLDQWNWVDAHKQATLLAKALNLAL